MPLLEERSQRFLNMQPLMLPTRAGTIPLIEPSLVPGLFLPGTGMQSIRPCVYGCVGLSKTSLAVPVSTEYPAYITMTRSAILATTPKSCVMRINPALNSYCRDFIRFKVCACIVTSRAVVGSSAIINAGSHMSVIAIIILCRRPPDSSCGY